LLLLHAGAIGFFPLAVIDQYPFFSRDRQRAMREDIPYSVCVAYAIVKLSIFLGRMANTSSKKSNNQELLKNIYPGTKYYHAMLYQANKIITALQLWYV
jgi:ATP/maltotriose-dependent transcriptional regulator MalT